MPTFTAIALDRFLEPDSRNPKITKLPPIKPTLPPGNSRRLLALPALYTTPEVTPLPDSPCSFPPSPYIINHKRRGPRLQNPPPSLEDQQKSNSKSEEKEFDFDESLGTKKPIVSLVENSSGDEDLLEINCGECERDGESEDFLDFLDLMSSASNVEGEDSFGVEQLRRPEPGTPMGEYYDAYDEISSDGSSRSSFRKTEDEIRDMRLNLLMEIEKNKQAEEAIENLQNKWENLRQHLSAVGLVLPDVPRPMEEEVIVDPAEDLSQQIVVARAVATSVARGCARAVAEMKMEPQIEAKNFEIARLLDRLRYYEAANREMSQRNQEAVEMARQRRHRRNRRQKWFWGSIGLTVTLGSAAIAWSYLPSSKAPSSPDN